MNRTDLELSALALIRAANTEDLDEITRILTRVGKADNAKELVAVLLDFAAQAFAWCADHKEDGTAEELLTRCEMAVLNRMEETNDQ